MGLKTIILLTIAITFANCNYKSYKDYRIYKIIPKSEQEVKIISHYKNKGDFDFWSSVREKKEVRIMVTPDKHKEFEEHLNNEGVEFNVIVQDVQKLVKDTLRRPSPNRISNEYSWDYYRTLDEINEWLKKMANDYPNVCEIVNMGTSFLGRNTTGLKIDFKKKENATIGLIEGGIHAREWISPATITWIIHKILTSSDSEIRSFAENVVWHIFPVTNPDGYVYSFTNNRMWRKNRNNNYFTSCAHLEVDDDISNGVDLNRNFGFYWNTVGASEDPCTQNFVGAVENSEPETRAIINYVNFLQRQGNLVYYLSFHSYMQTILIPYLHTIGPDVLQQVSNYADLYEIAIRSVTRLQQRHNTPYEAGGVRDLSIGGSGGSGASADWAKGVAKVPIVMLYEMRDTGQYGFLLPPEQIIPNCEEVMDSLVEMDRVTRRMGYYKA